MTKLIKNLMLIFLSLTLIFFFISCSPEHKITNNPVNLSVNVYQDADFDLIESDGETFKYNISDSIPDIKAGEIIIHKERNNKSYGLLLRKVVSVKKDKGTMIVTTEQEEIRDLFPSNTRFTSNDKEIKLTSYSETGEVTNIATGDIALVAAYIEYPDGTEEDISAKLNRSIEANLTYTKNFSGTTFYEKGASYSHVSDELNVSAAANFKVWIPNGHLTISPGIVVDWDYSWWSGEIKYFETYVQCPVDFELNAEAILDGHVSGNFERKLFEVKYILWQWTPTCPPVPVEETITISFYGGFQSSISGSASVRTGINANANVRAGAFYEDGDWYPIADYFIDFNWSEPMLAASVDAVFKPYIRNEIAVKFYGLIGPIIKTTPYFKFHANYTYPTPEIPWTLDAGIKSDLKFGISFIKGLPEYNRNLFDYIENIASGIIHLGG